MEKLYTKAEIEETDKGLLAVASTGVEDRHGEVVNVDGWDLKWFKKNPIIQWAHNHEEMAIGKAEKIRIEGEGKKARLVFQPVFHEVTELARAAKKLVEDGFLKAFSDGFRPLEAEENVFVKQELLEISLVNVPANQEAMMLAYKSLKDAGIGDKTIRQVGLEWSAELEDRLSAVEQQLDFVVKGLKHLNPHPGRKSESVTNRLHLYKAIDKAATQLLTEKSGNERTIKAIDRMTERLIVDAKRELKDGQNQRTPRQGSQTRGYTGGGTRTSRTGK